jgi:hypothetical protein
MARLRVQPRVVFVLTIVLLVLGALLPSRLTGWLTGLRGPALVVVAPISGPLSRVSVAARPVSERDRRSAAIEELEAQRDELWLLYERAAGEVARLSRLVEDLQQLPPGVLDSGAVSVLAERVGRVPASGTIEVRAGRAVGAGVGTVAVARRSNQLVGIVTSSGARVSTVRLITDGRLEPGIVRAVISDGYAEDPALQAALPWADFEPDGDGGLVANDVAVQPGWPAIEAGMLARVDDPDWPAEAQFFTLGEVVRVEEGDAPQFVRVTVRPLIDVSRVRSVLLRVAGNAGNEDGGGG